MKPAVALFAVAAILVGACTKQDTRSDANGPSGATKVAPRTCAAKFPPGQPKAGAEGECKADSDCTNGIEGRCDFGGNGRMMPTNRCTYDECRGDSDCKTGLCLCAGANASRNSCTPAGCHDDADCPGATCQRSPWGAGDTPSYGAASQYCTTRDDKCSVAKGDACGPGKGCVYNLGHSRWECSDLQYPPPG